MFVMLTQAEMLLPRLLRESPGNWESLLIDYDQPVVHRVWQPYGDWRICLHAIEPCAEGAALYHPHAWPSEMRLLSGSYEMLAGFGASYEAPPVAFKFFLEAGGAYAMVDRDAWHSVRPLQGPSDSVMVSGPPWRKAAPKSDRKLSRLGNEEKSGIIQRFQGYYLL